MNRMRWVATAAVLLAGLAAPHAQGLRPGDLRSGFEDMSRENQALQRDDTANPGMLWVQEGETLWSRKAGAANRSCADCHGEALVSMRGVAARYPAFDEQTSRPVDLQGRVNLCRTRHQTAPVLAHEGQELLALTAYIALPSRGMPVTPPDDPRLTPFRERGRALFNQRIGQLGLTCAQCHDANWGGRLGGSTIPQGHPNGYPLYRLEWQSVGSLQRRLRNCMTGVRAEPFAYGASEFVDLEIYLASRAKGLMMEAPAIRP
jgi:sulfur-oxidizing protein SoxA